MTDAQVHERSGRIASLSLTGTRAILGPAMITLAWFGAPGWILVASIAVAALTDVYDGKIARYFGVDTARLRRFDSVADTAFYIAVGIAMWIGHPDVLFKHAILIGAFFLMQVLGHVADVIKFGRDTSYHTWSGRTFGLALFVATSFIFATGRAGPWLVIALVTGMLAHIDAFVITLILPEWRHDVHTIANALRIRHALLKAQQTPHTTDS